MLQLASALGEVSPGFKQQWEGAAAQQKQEQEDLANRRINGMSFDEARAAVDSGKMSELQNPWFNAAFMKQYGERLAYDRVNQLSQEYETSEDKANIDFDTFVAQHMNEDLKQYGDNKFFVAGYTPVMQNFNRQGGIKATEYQTQQMVDESQNGAFQTFLGTAKSMLADGKSPAEIVAAIRGKYDGNRELLHLDYKTQDTELVRVAESLAADGNYALVKEILTGARTGSDGTNLGSLQENKAFAADSARILKAAQTSQFKLDQDNLFDARTRYNQQADNGTLDEKELLANVQQNPALMTEAQARALVNRSNTVTTKLQEEAAKNEQTLALKAQAYASQQALTQADLTALKDGKNPFLEEGHVVDEHGNQKTVPVEKRTEESANLFDSQLRAAGEAQGMSNDQLLAYEIQGFASNGIVFPRWKRVFAAGPTAATAQNLSGDSLPPALVEGTKLYMQMYDTAPQLLAKHITDEATMDFYEAYRIAQEYNGSDDRQALLQAVKVTQDPSAYSNPMYHQSLEEVMKRVPTYVGGFMGMGGQEVENQPQVVSEIAKLAEFYTRNGKNPDEALDLAKERFLKYNQLINGYYVNTGSADLPADFPRLAENAIDRYVQDFGAAEGIEKGDLTIAPYTNGSGVWIILNKYLGPPVEDPKRRFVTLGQMAQFEKERVEGLKQQTLEEQHRRAQERVDAEHELDIMRGGGVKTTLNPDING